MSDRNSVLIIDDPPGEAAVSSSNVSQGLGVTVVAPACIIQQFSGMGDSNAIRDAIERSMSSGQIQTVSVGLTVDALEDLLLVMMRTPWEMVEIDDNRVDVWGWSDATPEGEQDWRLVVQCVAAEEMVA